MIKAGRNFVLFAVSLALAACAKVPLATAPIEERAQIETALMRDISVLASDRFAGRQPGTEGEVLTVEYIIGQMQQAGLVSGTNDPGSAWKAPVALVSSTARSSAISIAYEGRTTALAAEDAAAFTSARRLLVNGASMIFVGSEGETVEPEMIAGKVVVMLGEPGVSPARRARLFEADPAAIITVVENAEAIANANRAFGRERVFLASEEEKRLSAFVTQAAMQKVLGEEYWNSLIEAAAGEDFAPGPLGAQATIEAASDRREFNSTNVLGLLPGQVRGSGAVLLLGHWDHLGECRPETSEDRICNGAIDNASGIAVMLELARRLSASGPLDRDIYFLATTAEESGLLGAKAFVEEPPLPLDSIVAAFNFDTVAIAPAGSPVGFVGEGRTSLDPVILEVMLAGKRELGDKQLAERFVRRQDGWALLEAGVPAVFLSSSFGSEIILDPYLSSNYHRPGDELEALQLGGAIDDLLLHEELIRRFASTTAYPAADK
ncbi:hypothetical protein MACH24_22500 [Erythrobacter sp. Dej080120_24]|uniref:M20/M25/M40 family metallo-hydrolase n=1 Tax=Erythrobacter sp. Dej080120_24 TaxID=3024837 RepID=UPI0029231466|nr:hypothetical protein MACH24_22500 [Erythrobacter sp. Dej080120_24]